MRNKGGMRLGVAIAIAACLGLVGESLADSSATELAKSRCAKGPLRAPIANCAPEPPPSTGDPHEDCVARINQLRSECQCLPPLRRWKGGEKCARKHAKHDMREGIHAGFHGRICKPQGRA
ncbi:MAG: hypothetical protein AAF436_04015, partial [Myxococcota bacterium]